MIYLQCLRTTDIEHIEDGFALWALDVLNNGVELRRHPLPVLQLSERSRGISLFPHLITLCEYLHMQKSWVGILIGIVIMTCKVLHLVCVHLNDNKGADSSQVTYLFNLLIPHRQNFLQVMHRIHICSCCFCALKGK